MSDREPQTGGQGLYLVAVAVVAALVFVGPGVPGLDAGGTGAVAAEQTPDDTPDGTPTLPEETPTPPEETPTLPEETPTPPEETPTLPDETPTPPEETPTPPEETPTPPGGSTGSASVTSLECIASCGGVQTDAIRTRATFAATRGVSGVNVRLFSLQGLDLAAVGVSSDTRFRATVEIQSDAGFTPETLVVIGSQPEFVDRSSGTTATATVEFGVTSGAVAPSVRVQDPANWPSRDVTAGLEADAVAIVNIAEVTGADRQDVATLDGVTIATNAQVFAPPTYEPATDNSPPKIELAVAAPHFLPDGQTVNEGTFTARLPDSLLNSWGVSDPSRLTAETSTGGGTLNVTETDSGVVVRLRDYHYSSGTVTVTTNNESSTATPTTTPDVTPTATPDATPTPTSEPTPTPTPDPTPTPEPTPTPTPVPTPTSEPTPTATPEPTPTPTSEPTPTTTAEPTVTTTSTATPTPEATTTSTTESGATETPTASTVSPTPTPSTQTASTQDGETTAGTPAGDETAAGGPGFGALVGLLSVAVATAVFLRRRAH